MLLQDDPGVDAAFDDSPSSTPHRSSTILEPCDVLQGLFLPPVVVTISLGPHVGRPASPLVLSRTLRERSTTQRYRSTAASRVRNQTGFLTAPKFFLPPLMDFPAKTVQGDVAESQNEFYSVI